jgi:hypothetical protein
MKRIVILLMPMLLAIDLAYNSLTSRDPQVSFGAKNNVEFIFNSKTRFDDLVNAQNIALKANGIVIKYKTLKFDSEGGLVSIEMAVDCKDGYSGAANSGQLQNSSKFGFKRDYSGAASSPFEIGNLD